MMLYAALLLFVASGVLGCLLDDGNRDEEMSDG